jgi:hypothetical protein
MPSSHDEFSNKIIQRLDHCQLDGIANRRHEAGEVPESF